MTIEPHDVRFQIGTMVPPSDAKTLAQYQSDLIRRFGKLPSPAELAKMENDARARSQRIYMGIPSKPKTKPAEVAKRKHHNSTLGEWHDKRALAAIPPEGATTQYVSAKVNRSSEGARTSLLRLKHAGLITSIAGRGNRPVTWFRVDTSQETKDDDK